jgi:DNA polymerase-1
MKKYLLIDGNAIMHRAFHALPDTLAAKDGTPTNAVYGFFTMLYKVVTDFQPYYVTICFDTPKPTFRKKLLEEYQAKRPKAADEFKVQVPIIQNLVDLAGINREEREGFEADDVIGSLAKKLSDNGEVFTLILTGDKDILQLVNKDTQVISPKLGLSNITIYDEKKVEEKLGIKPKLIPDYKSLAGDPSDNYHAAKGIGPKTAVKLLEQFGSIENIYKNTEKIEKERIRNILVENKEKVFLLKKIATIVQDLEIDVDLDCKKFSGFKEDMKFELNRLELNSLIKRFFKEKKDGQKGHNFMDSVSKNNKEENEDSQLALFS